LSAKERLLDFIGRQIDIENEIVESINRALPEIENEAVKGALGGISLDSRKHSDMYGSVARLLTGVPQALTQEQLDEQRELVEKHIRLEARLIKRISEVIPSVEDEKVELLLNAILLDEKRHHALLKKVLDILVRGETITEEEWFDFIWASVPSHGAPGG
jgi:bacterioferritin (cytochrome b1)